MELIPSDCDELSGFVFGLEQSRGASVDALAQVSHEDLSWHINQVMSNFWEKAGAILGGLSLIAAIGAFATPEIRCFFDLPSESCLPLEPELDTPKATSTHTPSPTQSPPQISTAEVAIVFDPPTNVRKSPNGNFLCSIRERTTININGSIDDWYYTDICGTRGVIHSSQITFQPN